MTCLRLMMLALCTASALATAADRRALVPPPPPPPPSSSPGDETPPPPPPSSSSQEEAWRDTNAPTAVRELPGWALGGAVLGFIVAPIVVGLAVGSAATTGQQVPSLPLGALATVMFGVTLPLVAASSSSVRSSTYVSGSTGLRVIGWILYGITLGLAVVAVVLGIANTVPAPIILGLGAGAALSTVFMCIDALVARSQAKALIARGGRRDEESSRGVELAPYATLSPTPTGNAAAMIGVGGFF